MAWRKLTVVWSFTAEDVRQTSLYFEAPSTLDQEDDVEALVDAWWAAADEDFSPLLSLIEYRWYFSATPLGPGDPWGEADRQIARSLNAVAVGGTVPPQCAIVVGYTQPAPFKRHRGRNYLPTPNVGALQSNGRLAPAVCARQATAWETLLQGCADINYHPCTPSRIGASVSWLRIETLHVDDDVDTQRRRGYDDFIVREVRTITNGP